MTRFTSLIVTVAGIMGATAQAQPSRTVALLEAGERPVRVVCLGDSITGAYYHTGSRRAYCDMLGIALERLYPGSHVAIVNAGISGNTSAQGLARLDGNVLAHEPDLVTIMFGINDMRAADPAAYRATMEELVDRCLAAGAQVVLCTPTWANDLGTRPVELQEQYVAAVVEIAAERDLAVADCHRAFRDLRQTDPEVYELAMSDAVHPNMNGHKLIAEVIAQAISGREVALADVPPPTVQMQRTLARIADGRPVRVIAMPPFDALISEVLRAACGAEVAVEVTTWPHMATVGEMEQWARAEVRAAAPDLVIVAAPADATAADRSAYVAAYEWTLNWSLAFGPGTWDCIPVLPEVATPHLPPEQQTGAEIARALVAGKDLQTLARTPGEDGSPAELLQRFIAAQCAARRATR